MLDTFCWRSELGLGWQWKKTEWLSCLEVSKKSRNHEDVCWCPSSSGVVCTASSNAAKQHQARQAATEIGKMVERSLTSVPAGVFQAVPGGWAAEPLEDSTATMVMLAAEATWGSQLTAWNWGLIQASSFFSELASFAQKLMLSMQTGTILMIQKISQALFGLHNRNSSGNCWGFCVCKERKRHSAC